MSKSKEKVTLETQLMNPSYQKISKLLTDFFSYYVSNQKIPLLEQLNDILRKDGDVTIFQEPSTGNTILHLVDSGTAVKQGECAAIITLFIDNGADVNVKNNDGNTPLHLAASESHMDSMKVFLNNGANPTEKNKSGNTPLHLAASSDYRNEEYYSRLSLIGAAYNTPNTPVKYLLNNGASYAEKNHDGDTALHLAALKGGLTAVKNLVENGANPLEKNNKGETPLNLAALNGHADVVKFLFEKVKARFTGKGNIEGAELLRAAEKGGHAKLVEWLQLQGVDSASLAKKNQEGYSPFLLAASEGLRDVLQAHFKGPASLEETTPDGDTALHLAVKGEGGGHLPVVKWLVEQGASLTRKNLANKTAFDLAGIRIQKFLQEPYKKEQERERKEHEEHAKSLNPSPSSSPAQTVEQSELQREITKQQAASLAVAGEGMKPTASLPPSSHPSPSLSSGSSSTNLSSNPPVPAPVASSQSEKRKRDEGDKKEVPESSKDSAKKLKISQPPQIEKAGEKADSADKIEQKNTLDISTSSKKQRERRIPKKNSGTPKKQSAPVSSQSTGSLSLPSDTLTASSSSSSSSSAPFDVPASSSSSSVSKKPSKRNREEKEAQKPATGSAKKAKVKAFSRQPIKSTTIMLESFIPQVKVKDLTDEDHKQVSLVPAAFPAQQNPLQTGRPKRKITIHEEAAPRTELSRLARTKIGRWGEELVYEKLKRRYQDKYKATQVEDTATGFKLIGIHNGSEKHPERTGKKIQVEVNWPNKKAKEDEEIMAPEDLIVTKSIGEDEPYRNHRIEVKSTRSKDTAPVEFSPQQWKAMHEAYKAQTQYEQEKAKYDEKKDKGSEPPPKPLVCKYSVFRVYDAGKKAAIIKKLSNPVKEVLEGTLNPQSIKFKI